MSSVVKLTKIDKSLALLHSLGLHHIARPFLSNFLTVLNYHRVDYPFQKSFQTFRPNISATPEDFERQMEYVSNHYDVISGQDLLAYLSGNRKLPKYPAIITFDDGYRDNYLNAYPILSKRNLPAIIFLTAEFIGTSKPFYWDLISYCFNATQRQVVDLPQLGSQDISNDEIRTHVMQELIDFLKKIPEVEKNEITGKIPVLLDVDVSPNAFDDIMMTWPEALEMSKNGIEIGGHTATHPILTRISLDEVSHELTSSKNKIESKIGKSIYSFAYPNGQLADFSDDIKQQVKNAGFEMAFSLLPGPIHENHVRENPFSIERIFIGYKDTFPRFVAKLTGLSKINFS